MKSIEKDCYCYTCEKELNHMGVMRHRAMYRDKLEDCKIEFSDGRIKFYKFSKEKK